MSRSLHALGALALGAMGGFVIYTQAQLRSAGEVVVDGFAALKSADFQALQRCYAEPAWAIVSQAVPVPHDSAARDRLRRYMGEIRSLRIAETINRGNTAEVKAVIEYPGGQDRATFLMTRARGTWHIALAAEGETTVAPPVLDDPRQVEAYLETDHARVTHHWLLRAIVDGTQPDEAPDPAYARLAGGLDDLSPAALADRTAADANELAKAAIIDMVRALLDRPDVVTAELARGLLAEGARAYLANDRIYRKWQSGTALTERDMVDYVARDGGLHRIAMGTELADDARLHAYSPGHWEESRTAWLAEVDDLAEAAAGYDALGVYLALRPAVDEAVSNLSAYVPYAIQRQELDALLSGVWDTVHRAAVELQAALVIAPNANMRRSGVYKTEGVEDFNEVLWRYEAGDRVAGQPVVRNKTLYYATSARYRWDSSYVRAVDVRTRQMKWSFEAPARRCTSITLMGTRLYLSCGDEGAAPAYLCAIDTLTGNELWSFRGPRGSEGLLSHPAMDERDVYVADNWGALFGLDGETGDEKWRFEGSPSKTKSPPTPSLAGSTIYLPAANEVYAIDTATGTQQWRLAEGSSDGMVAVDDRNLYFYHRGLSAVSLANRQTLWRFEPTDRSGSLRGCPAVDGNTVYARDQQIVYAVDAETGDLIWRLDLGRPIDWKTSPVVAGGMLYIGSGAAADDQDKSCLHAIDTGTGRERWRLPLDLDLFGSAPIVAAGVVYLSAGDQVYAVH